MLLRLIIIKKLLVAVLLLTVAVLALVGSYRYDQLPQLLQECTDTTTLCWPQLWAAACKTAKRVCC